MATPRQIDKQKPATRNTIKSSGLTFFLDEQQRLLFKADSVPYPFPLDNQTTLALANLLVMNYKDIAAAAKPYAFVAKPGRKE